MSPDYFNNQLYPLQDRALQVIASAETSFYLTGGTAVSRHYLHHRFSDDLDLFVNRSPFFTQDARLLIAALSEQFEDVLLTLESEDFLRLFVNEGAVKLKIELINDVAFRVGAPLPTPLFSRTDTWQNILANKITALGRDAPKDVADLILLARKFPFQWRDAIDHAGRKDMMVSELDVSAVLYDYDIEKLLQVNWILPPDLETLHRDVRRMGLDVLEGIHNSLAAQ